MSQENVEVVRSSTEAFNAGGVEAALAYIDPNVVIHPYREWLEGAEPLRGHDGFRLVSRWWTSGGFSEPHIEIHELRDIGDSVVALWRQTANAVASGTSVTQETGAIASGFRDRRIGEIKFFLTWQQALEAARLSD